MAEPLTAVELAELEASIDHLSGPDAWDENRLEPALIPVTHYVPRLLAERDALAARVAERASDAADEAAARVRVRAWLDEWSLKVQRNLVATGCGRSAPDGCTELTAPDIDALLAGRKQLAKRVARCDADVRAVARLLRELRNHPDVAALRPVTRVAERFAGRIAALDARTTDGGAT